MTTPPSARHNSTFSPSLTDDALAHTLHTQEDSKRKVENLAGQSSSSTMGPVATGGGGTGAGAGCGMGKALACAAS